MLLILFSSKSQPQNVLSGLNIILPKIFRNLAALGGNGKLSEKIAGKFQKGFISGLLLNHLPLALRFQLQIRRGHMKKICIQKNR